MALFKEIKENDREVKECDLDLTKSITKKKKSPKTLVKKVYVERKIFTLGLKQEKIFNVIKTIILNNIFTNSNSDVKFYWIVNPNVSVIKRVLF